MKTRTYTIPLILLMLFLFSCVSKKKKKEWAYNSYNLQKHQLLPNKIRKELMKDFVVIHGGSFISGSFMGTDTFSSLILERKITVPSMYMGKYEASVGEYMAFYHETSDSANKPDTLSFCRDFYDKDKRSCFVPNEFMAKCYFWHPKYKNYPISGVSFEQAQRFCEWKTRKINESLAQYGNKQWKPEVHFRLPTTYELEYAMVHKGIWKLFYNLQEDIQVKISNSNTKGVVDENSIALQDYDSDGYTLPAPVNAYPPNELELHNVTGNVAEWTQTPLHYYLSHEKPTSDMKKDNPYSKFILDTLTLECANYEKNIPPAILNKIKEYQYKKRVLKVISDSSYNLVKGGSYYHGSYYAQPGTFIPEDKNAQHSWLGFRLVMEIVWVGTE